MQKRKTGQPHRGWKRAARKATERGHSGELRREHAIMIARIIEDEIGGEICTPEWAQAAADRIVCALGDVEQTEDRK